MQFKKNDITELVIDDISISGEGIGKAEGYTLFVRDAVPGDRLEVQITKTKSRYGYARIRKIICPSPDRVEPVCPVAGPCGGCQLQHMSYQAQCVWKENRVRNDLERIGGFHHLPMQPIVCMEEPFHYRNKAQFPVGYDGSGNLAAGFYAAHSHRIIPLVTLDTDTDAAACPDAAVHFASAECQTDAKTDREIVCRIGQEINLPIVRTVLMWMRKYNISAYDEHLHRGCVRHILIRCGYRSDEVIVCLAVNAKRLPHGEMLADMLRDLNCGIVSLAYSPNLARTNVILGDTYKVIRGETYMTDQMNGNRFRISPLSFYQVNPAQTERLYQKAAELAQLTGRETVFDLYCGIGTISLTMAAHARCVYGVEIVPQAVEDARNNAALNRITNAEFFAGRAEEVVPTLYAERGIRADVVVVDPPRKGCDGILLGTILQMQPDRIVYVSCNPSTLARDLRILCDGGYTLQYVQAYDQFAQTCHVETIVLLQRGTL